ncbi:MAG TPA: DUF3006 domain-containing protein [Syntrophomonadaceae bacterium]|nr:DUF3006 domain-containing protein [Syntrophomonadaceae bacterium]
MFIIDRIENDIVVVEYEGRTYDLPRKIMPLSIKEGDVISFDFHIDREATKARHNKVEKLVDDLFK